jgi:hypothetical protein
MRNVNLLSLQHCTCHWDYIMHTQFCPTITQQQLFSWIFIAHKLIWGQGIVCSANMPTYHLYSDYSVCKLNHCYTKPLMCNLHEVSVIYLVLFLLSYVWTELFLVPTFYPNTSHHHNKFKVIIPVHIMAFLHFSITNPHL